MMRWRVDAAHPPIRLLPSLHSPQRAAPAISPSAPEPVVKLPWADTVPVLHNRARPYRTCRPKSVRCRHIWRAWRRNVISTLQRCARRQAKSRLLIHVGLLFPALVGQLRDIEILVQQQIEVLEAAGKDDDTLREIQKILYSTEVYPFPFLIHIQILIAQ